jgi:uncharacterized Zn ribbon protein
MNTNKCKYCDHLFWCDDPEQAMCPECKEEPNAIANQDRAIEQWIDYLKSLREKENQ